MFDREARFIERVLAAARASATRGCASCSSTSRRARRSTSCSARAPASPRPITPQHLLLNRNALFAGGIRPHHYCLPVLKREAHRAALVAAATGGSPRFFLGTDSAPHARRAKEAACGCAGIFSAHAAIELYAEVFEAAGALDQPRGLRHLHGADFYGLPRNTDAITLIEASAGTVPAHYPFGADVLVPLRAGERSPGGWRLRSAHEPRSRPT